MISTWGEPILGSEAVASGVVYAGSASMELSSDFIPTSTFRRDTDATMATKAAGALVVVRATEALSPGRAAASLHGALWVDDATPVELVWANNHSPVGIVTRRDRIADDEICDRLGICRRHTAARAALDLGRKLPRDKAPVAHLDALARREQVITMEDDRSL